jgi:hypothetical protein
MVDRGEWWCEFFLLHYSLLQLHRKPLPMCQTWISWKNMYGRIEDCLLIASVSQFNITWEWKWRTRTLLLSSTCFGARYFKQFVHMLHFLILWHNYITSKKIELKYPCASCINWQAWGKHQGSCKIKVLHHRIKTSIETTCHCELLTQDGAFA